jgi:uncharacterized membrane protein YdfJ with MMPL/SSD domain
MTTLLPEFRAQLHSAAERRVNSRRRRVVSRLTINGRLARVATTIPVLLSVLLAVGIAIVAIATLSHRHSATVTGTAPEVVAQRAGADPRSPAPPADQG